jgi:phytanoyl-CoA hydroxylase
MKLKKDMKNSYFENGYILIKNLFEKEEIIKIKKDINKVFDFYCGSHQDKDVINIFKKDFEGFIGCTQICQNLISLYDIFVNKSVIKVIKQLGLKQPCINTKPLISFSCKSTAKNECYWKVPAHQDWPSTQGSINGITCWVPLLNVDKKLGPLELSPKTHLLGFLDFIDNGVPVLKSDDYSYVSVPMSIGDALFFSNFTIHRSGINLKENKIRLSAHFRYDDFSENSFIERKYPHHRIDKRKEGILFPNFPNSKQIKKIFKTG